MAAVGRSCKNLRTNVTFRLDFTPAASVCRSMEKQQRDLIAELFADLTGQLEDAAELAASGQSSKLSKPAIEQLVNNLRQQLTTCDDVLKHIERRLQSGLD